MYNKKKPWLNNLTCLTVSLLFFITCIFNIQKFSTAFYDSSVLTLLSNERQSDPEKEFLHRLDSEAVFLISSPKGEKAADYFKTELEKYPFFSKISLKFDRDPLKESWFYLSKHKSAFLNDELRAALLSPRLDRRVLKALYSQAEGVSGAEFVNDPLLLLRDELKTFGRINKIPEIQNGMIIFKDGDKRWILINAKSSQDGFSGSAQLVAKAVNACISSVQREYPHTEVIKRAAFFYSAHATATATRDLTLLGSLTLLGIILLSLIAFKSLKPLLLISISLVFSLNFACAAVFWCFDNISPLVLVLGLCVIGLCTDYTVYYVVRRKTHCNESAVLSIKKLSNELYAAYFSSAAAYAVLMFSPFPLLKELSLFCVAGLSASLVFVLTIEPKTGNFGKQTADLKYAYVFLKLLSGKKAFCFILLLVAVNLIGMQKLCFNDDPSALQEVPRSLLNEDKKVEKIMGTSFDQTWILLTSPDETSFKQDIYTLRKITKEAIARGIIQKAFLPPINPDEIFIKDRLLVNNAVLELACQLKDKGIRINTDSYLKDQNILLEDFFKKAPGIAFAPFYMTYGQDKNHAFMIQLTGLDDPQALRQLLNTADGNFKLIDRRHDYTLLFKACRENALTMLLIALMAVFVLELIKFKLKRALICFIPPVLSIISALCIPALFGFESNLFSITALLLVLGIGIDYTLFFSNSSHQSEHTLYAVTVCALTTLLSLGILFFSNTYAVSVFGLTLSIGIAVSYVLAVICRNQDV